MKIYDITDKKFCFYGRIINDINWEPLLKAMESTPLPDQVVYEPSVPELEGTPVFQQVRDQFYGELPIQIGYCNGNNYCLNALEYHRTSEVNVAAADMILLLGKERDITEGFTYDTGNVEAFLVPEGTAVELYGDTLHYAPCNADENGFKVAVILPKGTNLPLDKQHQSGEAGLLAAKNKWLIGHREGNLPEGTHLGLTGENISLKKQG